MFTLSRFQGRRVGITTYALDGEGATLGMQIVVILRAAGISVEDRTASMMPIGGFAPGVHVSGTRDDLVSRIRTALSAFGHLVVAPAGSPTQGGSGMSTGAGSPAPVDAEILIGVKPIPMMR